MNLIRTSEYLLMAFLISISGCQCQDISKRSEEMIIPSAMETLPPPASSGVKTLFGSDRDPENTRTRAFGNAAALDTFKILENTIIQTKESRASGAKYLNESSQATRQSCINWCKDYQNLVKDSRESCDVAVFEETGKKSCYLFNCGPSGPGFKCQFTSHMSYTSFVLNRASIDLNEWRDQSDHENDLVNLRKVLPPPPNTRPSAAVHAPEPIEVGKKNSEVPTSELQPNKKRAGCHDFQFACKNSSDCIAIYNVCDGIAQCPDASDESLDRCNRPVYPSLAPPPPLSTRQTDSPIFFDANQLDDDEADRMKKQLPGRVTMESPNFFQYSKSGSKTGMGLPFFPRPYSVMTSDKPAMQQQQLSPAQQSSSLLQPVPQENSFYSNYPLYSPVEYFSSGDVLRTSGSAGYNIQRSQMQQQQQVPVNNDYTREGAAAPSLFWPLVSSGKQTPDSQVIVAPPVSRFHLPRASDDAISLRPSSGDDIRLWRPPYADPHRMESSQRKQFPDWRLPDQEVGATRGVQPDNENIAKASNKVESERRMGKESASVSKSKPQLIVSHRESHETPIAISHLRDSDQSGRDTNSAVIALTLGLSITAMLIGIVGCRMKSIRKRIARRGGRSLAHDADYLVNGMYL